MDELAITWMNPKDIMLSEISQSQKDKYYDPTYMTYIEQSNFETESRVVVARGWGRQEWEVSV